MKIFALILGDDIAYIYPDMKIFTLILGDDIAYIYPDMKMAIRGEFKDEKLGKIFNNYFSDLQNIKF